MTDLSIIELLKSIDIRTVDPSTLVDIRDVFVDRSLPQKEQTIEYVRKIGNPYCFKYGKSIVKTSHADTEVTMEDRVESIFLSMGG